MPVDFGLVENGDGLQNRTWNETTLVEDPSARTAWEWDDAAWILAASFVIFSMQTGFGMLESGVVSLKNEVNIMMKNVVDVVLGGLTYWAFGYGLTFGESEYSNPFIAFGSWFVDAKESEEMGATFVTFLFQLSFATTATTIVSGAMAERCNFNAYCLFSLVNTIVYCIPAHWLWSTQGFLYNLGAVDIAGSGGVHLIGGVSAVVAATMLGPRLGRWDIEGSPPMGSPTNALVGLFMLWWGWLAFNSGSTFGVTGNKWRLAAKATVTTMVSSFGGGLISLIMSYMKNSKKIDVLSVINGVLGSLVAVTGSCAVITVWEAFAIGTVGAFLANITDPLLIYLKIDDAVGATCVHGFGGLWGVLAVGLFASKDELENKYCLYDGLFHGGGFYLLGVQLLTAVCLASWSAIITFLLLYLINKVVPIRMEPHEELIGADFFEHDIRHPGVGVSRAVSVLKNFHPSIDATLEPKGYNKGHDWYIRDNYIRKPFLNKSEDSGFTDNRNNRDPISRQPNVVLRLWDQVMDRLRSKNKVFVKE